MCMCVMYPYICFLLSFMQSNTRRQLWNSKKKEKYWTSVWVKSNYDNYTSSNPTKTFGSNTICSGLWHILIIAVLAIIIILLFGEIFTPALVESFSTVVKWKQVSLRTLLSFSVRSQKCCSSDGLHSSSHFQDFQSL